LKNCKSHPDHLPKPDHLEKFREKLEPLRDSSIERVAEEGDGNVKYHMGQKITENPEYA